MALPQFNISFMQEGHLNFVLSSEYKLGVSRRARHFSFWAHFFQWAHPLFWKESFFHNKHTTHS